MRRGLAGLPRLRGHRAVAATAETMGEEDEDMYTVIDGTKMRKCIIEESLQQAMVNARDNRDEETVVKITELLSTEDHERVTSQVDNFRRKLDQILSMTDADREEMVEREVGMMERRRTRMREVGRRGADL